MTVRAGRAALAAAVLLVAAGLAVAAGPGAVRAIHAHESEWRAFAGRHLIAAAALFILAYGAAVTVMLPVALVLTVASGVLFGAVTGAVLSVLGALTGAVTAYLLTRRFGAVWSRRARFDGLAGGAGHGAFALVLASRLTPLVPFTPVSIAAGAARMPLLSFALATGLGVAPESAIYAGIGAGAFHLIAAHHAPAPQFLSLGALTLADRRQVAPTALANLRHGHCKRLSHFPLGRRLKVRFLERIQVPLLARCRQT